MKKIILFASALLLALQVSAQTGLKVGEKAPEFIGVDNSGKTLNMKALLAKHKAVVLFFYRGQWCPYCNKQISHLQDSLQLLTGKGAFVVGVTPETGENINKTIDKTHASFAIIQDQGYKIMQAYQVNYVVDAVMLSKLKGYGVDLEKNNGNTDHVLPVPATYVINKSGKIIYAHVDKDYTKRPPVSDLLKVLN
jgi:peroxiredoxin